MVEIINFENQKTKDVTAVKADVLKTLKELTERAERGDLVGLAYVTVGVDGLTGTGWDGYGRKDLAFGIGLLNHRYNQAVLENP